METTNSANKSAEEPHAQNENSAQEVGDGDADGRDDTAATATIETEVGTGGTRLKSNEPLETTNSANESAEDPTPQEDNSMAANLSRQSKGTKDERLNAVVVRAEKGGGLTRCSVSPWGSRWSSNCTVGEGPEVHHVLLHPALPAGLHHPGPDHDQPQRLHH